MTKNEKQETESTLVAPTESPLMIAAELVRANGNMDVGKLEKLLAMQERYDATQAKKSYVEAMSKFKENPPEILKDKTVRYKPKDKPEVVYKHASLHNVTTCINKALSEHGFHAAWVTNQNDKGAVEVTCKITHKDGHSEQTCLSAPPDTTGSKNVIQAIGSTVKYLQRYTLLALTGLATHEQDDDGAGAGKPTKKDEQNAIVDQAFFDFECEQKEALLEGFVYSREKFEAAIIKRKKRLPLPTDEDPIRKILDVVKPEEVMIDKSESLEWKDQ